MSIAVREVRKVESPDHYAVSQTWYEADYRPLHRFWCRVGLHGLARALRADGWSGFNQTLRYECACGRYYWLRDGIGYSSRMYSGGHSSLPREWERESSLGRDTEGHLVLTLGPGGESPSRKEGWDELDGLSPLEQYNREGR